MGKGYNRTRSSQKKGEYNSKRRARRIHLRKMKMYKKDNTPLGPLRNKEEELVNTPLSQIIMSTKPVSPYIKGNKRLNGESFEDYKIRIKHEKKLTKLYLRGEFHGEETLNELILWKK